MAKSTDNSAMGLVRRIFRSIALMVLLIVLLGLGLTQPSCTHYPASTRTVNPADLRRHVEMLSEELAPRNFQQEANLNATAQYIADHFKRAGLRVSEQPFLARDNEYKNVVARFGPESGPLIVIGAHYDSCGLTPGADDNASGIAGLIELGYLLGRTELSQPVELVAFSLEEPPFFATQHMGSAHHAASLRKGDVDVEAMICLEMIGYFSDEPKSQQFPIAILGWFYPDEGNFIAVAGSTGDRRLVRRVKAVMRGATDLPVHAICAPRVLPGLDFSDHRNYWAENYDAVMITDTAFYRNRRYHKAEDTADTLDYARMAKVVVGAYEAVVELANGE
ncbi:MAG: M28 family peptidase [Pontiellaceae bacterium]|nr:M28 family peptidase [Pontiellaceae bacterium]MBN2783971.1 M28 family peptidase [Pontiellaceae bacterium]